MDSGVQCIKQDLTTIILTYNESKHIERCINSVKDISSRVVVVDSYSDDDTVDIAKSKGADVFQNKFINQAKQFQWALNECDINTEWTIKLDADEYLLESLREELVIKLSRVKPNVSLLYLKLRLYFMGKWVKRGYYPLVLPRVFRTKHGYMEDSWMDEHIRVRKGESIILENDFVDENLNTLTFWTQKHNNYATREVLIRLNNKYKFSDEILKPKYSRLKEVYLKFPRFIRPFFLFSYRYFFSLGFLDGREGLIWHFLQSFWYQFLIDAKEYQIEYIAIKENKEIKEIIFEELNNA
ncbi:glycosyltransferase family 2 protein [Tenacibaculum sp.]|uniref:glycosyltransferase family 2 protein n=1 Tax=Tenacibaculum sp. TaxID=1906242 RepID=UPI003AA7CC83